MANKPSKPTLNKQDGIDEPASKRWYVVQVHSGQERSAVKFLQEKIKVNNLNHKFGEILVPTEEVVEMRSGKKKQGERKFFPGYVLVQMVLDDETWHLVRSTPKVVGFIGGKSEKPTPITEKEADIIKQSIQAGAEKPKPKIIYEPGEVVRVIDGPFTDFNGVVEEVNYEKSRLRVAVLIFGRSTPVELEFSQVEKA